ncbi:hypothetical protein GIB67_000118, partial [Kingdonia uniflora]
MFLKNPELASLLTWEEHPELFDMCVCALSKKGWIKCSRRAARSQIRIASDSATLRKHESIQRSNENVNSTITWTEYKSMTFTSMVISKIVRLANIILRVFRRTIKEVEKNDHLRDEPPRNFHLHLSRFGKSNEPTSNPSSTRVSSVQPNVAPARKHLFASSLNSASPPFYPSSSFNQDVPVPQKRDSGIINKTSFSYPFEENFSSNSSGVPRGKNASRSNSQDRSYIYDSIRPVVGKSSNLHSSGSSSQRSSNNQVVRVSQQAHANQRPTSKASSTDSSENEELDSPTSLNKSKTALVGKGKTQSNGRIPSFLYNGAAGSMGLGHGDHNFPGAPALLQ